MTSPTYALAGLGWKPFFSMQLDADEHATLIPVRVIAVHRHRIHITGPGIDMLIPPLIAAGDRQGPQSTVGDWLLYDPTTQRLRRRLERMSLFKRRAAGPAREIQLIAANVDTLFIVSSCNQDFNIARLERYLTLARETRVTPVVVLTKADLSETPQDFARSAAKLLPGLVVEVLDARHRQSAASLLPWCGAGETVALVGSSGVGKSTLIQTLTGDEIATQQIRVDDAKGRHTTTARAFHRLQAGGWLLDTPGMRELQLTDVSAGLADVFADIVALAQTCRFSDCKHESEPGCAVQSAMALGALTVDRLKRWRKLSAENARNDASLATRRATERAFGRMVKRVKKLKQQRQEE
ncbi:MAG: ribosome small subunit-dependent GTPase A [Pseudomonadota bacterium]|jgi:ribosome biogenesis GTPase / thiamine phosphate phosphatase